MVDGREQTDIHFHVFVLLAESIDERSVVGIEFVGIVGPVARIGIVETQMYDHHVGAKGQRVGIFGQVHVGIVAVAQERGTVVAEIAHFVGIAQ